MSRAKWLQETRQMRFKEAYEGWTGSRLTQEEAAVLLGVCARTFRRYVDRYEEDGLDGLCDQRLCEVSHRRAPVDEVMKVVTLSKLVIEAITGAGTCVIFMPGIVGMAGRGAIPG